MSQLAPIAEFSDYLGLIRALRAGFEYRNISPQHESVSRVAGVADRYLPKLLGPQSSPATKKLSPVMLMTIVGVIGVKFQMVPDDQAWNRVKDRLDERSRVDKKTDAGLLASGATSFELPRKFFKEIGAKGGKAKYAKHGRLRCSQMARKAMLARNPNSKAAMRRAKARKAALARWQKEFRIPEPEGQP